MSLQQTHSDLFHHLRQVIEQIDRNQTDWQTQALNSVRKIAEANSPIIARAMGYKGNDAKAVVDAFIAEFQDTMSRSQINNSTIDSHLTASFRKSSLIKEQIPALESQHFPNDRVRIFHMSFPPLLDTAYRLLWKNTDITLKGKEFTQLFYSTPFFGVYSVVDELEVYKFRPPRGEGARVTRIQKEIQGSQATHLTEFIEDGLPLKIENHGQFSLSKELLSPLNKIMNGNYKTLYHASATTFPGQSNKDKLQSLREVGSFGVPSPNIPLYLTTDESVALSHCAQEGAGYELAYEIEVSAAQLAKSRNIFVDPNILTIHEAGRNYLIGGGIPLKAIETIRVLKRENIIIQGEPVGD